MKDDAVCCGKVMRFDPLREGTTCGGLEVVGALVCDACNTALVTRQSKPAERWKLASSGRSIETGITRVRAEAAPGVEDLMKRIVRLPDYERALRAIAAGAPNALLIARRALAEQIKGEKADAVIVDDPIKDDGR